MRAKLRRNILSPALVRVQFIFVVRLVKSSSSTGRDHEESVG